MTAGMSPLTTGNGSSSDGCRLSVSPSLEIALECGNFTEIPSLALIDGFEREESS
jgi:hypothetical protein